MNPPAGPLDVAPDVTPDAAAGMLDEALDGIVFGAYDQQVIQYIGFAEPSYVAAVASLLRRAWEAGLEAGRAERVELEAGDECEFCGEPSVADLCASCARSSEGLDAG